ncbi:MAG: hypothetical protein LBD84_06905 [Campylobacteraceae bacterium]|jgi:hypothetical protein|nr:hypothetical protein [Campylobacteraceae bacterium]
MQETLSLLKNILLYSTIFFALCALAGIIISLKSKEHKVLKKRLSFLNPTYYLFFSVITFSFIVTLALKGIFVLIDGFFALFLIFILFGGIKVYKIGKNRVIFENFSNFIFKKYCCDMAICIVFYYFTVSDLI